MYKYFSAVVLSHSAPHPESLRPLDQHVSKN